ncbi:Actin-binding Rho-activating protein [Folsomia candida]|uniref:Actin-binding Rho-activating protein n=1 Tax=Folsomia candida TaxID=158441 RepID=A0A226E3U4_FOLCA|nr:Actin-binding Rho-activating protein [Folsomia candida]
MWTYGRPPEGSKTEMRGLKANSHISKEVLELCTLIRTYGESRPDGRTLISFGELFQMYTVISNKVVGILLRARKHGLLTFDGEMLYQRRDEGKVITLFPKKEEDEEEEEDL